jgi:hypothetical protein
VPAPQVSFTSRMQFSFGELVGRISVGGTVGLPVGIKVKPEPVGNDVGAIVGMPVGKRCFQMNQN